MIDPIPGLPGYFATENGEIYSNLRSSKNPDGNFLILKQYVVKAGYKKFMARKDGKKINFLVHRAVALALLGAYGAPFEVCHNDGDRSNNRLDNLRWDTRKGNHHDKLAHGTQIRGESVYNAKLTLAQVKIIRDAYDNRCHEHWGLARLSKEFGVHLSTINDVAKRRTWTWI